jgi:hypothetical protein
VEPVGVSSAEVWQLVSGPFDPRLKTLRVLTEWLDAGGGDGCGLELLYSTEVKGVETLFSSIEELEMAARLISEMKTAMEVKDQATNDKMDKMMLFHQDIASRLPKP